MTKTPKIRAKVVIVADDARAALIGVALDAIMGELVALDAPFITPNEMSPRLGICVEGVRKYCRGTKSLRAWRGQYRFQMDDAQHIEALRDVLRLALWSMNAVPEYQKVQNH